VTFRAYDKVAFYKEDLLRNMELGANTTFSNMVATRYLSLRLDIICNIIITSTVAMSVFQKGKIDPGLLSLSLQILTDVVSYFSFFLRSYNEYESLMTASQRII
jgi:hypothetical protein